jgi:hypothetical protein
VGELVVTPETYEKVFFTNAEVIASVEASRAMVPGASELGDVQVNVDETVQTNRVRISSAEPWVFEVHSGAMEDTTTPRTFSGLQTKVNMGRLWYEALDRANSDFGAPGIETEISKETRGAWDIYCYGRVARLGLRMHRPRYVYNFHNWVGFSDAATAVFDELWDGEGFTFADLEAKVADLTPTRTI